jgi:3,4-dihydroxy-2-butanone 4-phosphate synthase
MFILVDDEDRENEGDLVIPAEKADAAAVNFMAKHGRGLICLALESAQVKKLGLPLAIALSLGDQALPQNILLRLAHACESNDVDTLIALSRELGVNIDSLSAAYLDGVIAGESLEAALA